jgi:hypothetical protein
VTGSIFLTAGLHSFEVDHFQGGGGTGVNLYLPPGVNFATGEQIQEFIPEPSTIALFTLGLFGCATVGWRRWRRKVA